MSSRRSQEDMIGWMVFALMAFVSGILLWAITGGVAVTGVVYWVSREWRSAFRAGVIATAVISALGIGSMVNPGWYQSLL